MTITTVTDTSAKSSIAATSTSSTASGTTASATTTGTTLNSNYLTFLNLLTTQLQNQDPLSPLDTNQFTSQLVQFAEVEQQMNTNTSLTSLLSTVQQQNTSQAVGYIGKDVTYDGDTTHLDSTGTASWTYDLPSDAASTTLQVVDSSGDTVKILDGETSEGSHSVTWDGTNSSGTRAAAGDYTLKVTALDDSDNSITASTSITGTVESVEVEDATPYLMIGGQKVSISSITGVTPTDA